MANRRKKIDLDKIDDEIGEVDNSYMVSSNPLAADVPVGVTIYVNLPGFSRRLKMLRLEQFEKGLITQEEMSEGAFKLSDGTMLKLNKTYELKMTPEIKDYLRRGILRGGGRTKGVKKYRMVTKSIQEIEGGEHG